MNILSTKLHRPTPPPRRVERLAILDQLNEGLKLGRPVTLVSAPPGFGKTTCISEWLSELALPAAWLSLDADDNAPERFFVYLSAALAKANGTGQTFPQLREIEGMLRSGQQPPAEAVAAALVSDIEAMPHSCLLVLDDFHVIRERYILKVFEKLITGLFLPNIQQPLHLVILTREDPALPLARLRANNQMTEIRADQLRFSRYEASTFLKDVMGLALAENDVVTLEERTEGWIAGLQLASLSIRGRANPASFIRSLSGSHRSILSYLTEEVLSRQPQEIQQFMLDTSILDQLSGDLCNVVTGRSDSHALLEQLWNSNLFLISLDDEQHWYRYHHLFADLLRSRQSILQGEKTGSLHQRASLWYAQACEESALGEQVAFADDAVRHSLAAKDFPKAVDLIEQYALVAINQWYAKTVSEWMQALPPEWSLKSPRTNLAFARMQIIRGDFAQLARSVERLQAIFSDSQNEARITPALRADWMALQSTLCSAQGQAELGLELARQALAIVPSNDSGVQNQAYLALATAYQHLEDIPHAVEAFQTLIQLGRSSNDMVIEMIGLSALSLLLIQRGRLRAGYELALQGAELIEKWGYLLPIGTSVYGELGAVAYYWNQIDEAEQFIQRAVQESVKGGFTDAAIYLAVTRSRLALVRGDIEVAERELQKAAEFSHVEAPIVVGEEFTAQKVILLLAQNRVSQAEQVLVGATGKDLETEFPPVQKISYPQGVLVNCIVRLLLKRGIGADRDVPLQRKDDLLRGIELANQLYANMSQYVPLVLETLLLRAQIHAALGRSELSLADYSSALEMAEPEGFISVFILEGLPAASALTLLLERCPAGSPQAQFIRKVLSAFPDLQPAPFETRSQPVQQAPSVLAESMTPRELEVLRLVAEGKTYEEIAGELVVSINTVRTHVKSIYGKLDVNNRTAAILAARQLNLV